MAHQILPGSLSVENDMLTVGVHVGPSAFDIKDLRYVQTKFPIDMTVGTLVDFLGQVYDNSTGCLIKGTFKVND